MAPFFDARDAAQRCRHAHRSIDSHAPPGGALVTSADIVGDPVTDLVTEVCRTDVEWRTVGDKRNMFVGAENAQGPHAAPLTCSVRFTGQERRYTGFTHEARIMTIEFLMQSTAASTASVTDSERRQLLMQSAYRLYNKCGNLDDFESSTADTHHSGTVELQSPLLRDFDVVTFAVELMTVRQL
jgi:hypothetical protein